MRARARRVRTQPILQMEAAECGAAALAIVLAHHRVHVPLERLREECNISRDGTNAARLLQVARRYGFEASGYSVEPEALAALPLPAILHWSFDHFVVLEGMDARGAWLNDPDRGRLKVTRAELDRCFTGPVLLFRPGPGCRPQGSAPRLLPTLWAWVSGSRSALVYLALLGLFLVLPGIAVPALSRVFVDDVLGGGRSTWVGPLLAGMAVTALCRGLLTWLQRDALARLSCRLVVGLSARYLWRALRLPFSFYLARHPADVAARVEIGDRLSWLLSGDLPAVALSAVTAIFFWLLMVRLDPWLAAIALLFALGGLAVDRAGAAARAERASQETNEQARLVSLAVGGLQMIETLKANGVEGRYFERWSAQQARVVAATQSLGVWSEGLAAITRLLHAYGSLAVLGLGGLRVAEGAMTLGTLVAFQSLLASLLAPLGELARFAGRLDEVKAEVARFQDVLEHPAEPRSPPGAGGPGAHVPLGGQVELRGVAAGYGAARAPVVEGIDLLVPPGGRVAFVGRTGSGKSTIARLLAGLLPARDGQVLFDGRPRPALSPHAFAAGVATVEQEVQLFEATIAENLTLWDPAIRPDALLRAVEDACLSQVIERLGGLDARVAEGGSNFSGGERQRLALARALARDPVILVLDEATSALDADTERRVYERLARRGCTCIVIAHRLSAVRDSDEILVLEGGRVVERGRHEELWAAGGTYTRLLASE